MFKKFDFEEFNKGFDNILDPKKIEETANDRIINEYIQIVNQVIDKKRDEDLSKLIFDEDGIDVMKVIKTIDNYREKKEKFEETFKKSVTVKREPRR